MKLNKPLKILIMDAYCASHVGNDVLLENSTRIIKQLFTNPIITIHAKTPDAFEKSQGLRCKRRLFPNPPARIIKKIIWLLTETAFMLLQFINLYTFKVSPYKLTFGQKRQALYDIFISDVCISISGEIINDSFRKMLPFYMFMYWLAWKLGKDVIIFPQSIGPLNRKWTRALTRFVLEKCIIVTARDKVSYQELLSLRLNKPHIIQSPDVGVSQAIHKQHEVITFLKHIGLDRQTSQQWIGVTVSAWTEEGVESGEYLHALAEALITASIKHKLGIIIMPANMPVNGNSYSDYDASVTLYNMLRNVCKTIILRPDVIPARLFKGIIGELNIFISTRMHASILSTMACTPTITLNTQRKLSGFMELIGQNHYSLDIEGITSKQIDSAISDIMHRSDTIITELNIAKKMINRELNDYIIKLGVVLGDLSVMENRRTHYVR